MVTLFNQNAFLDIQVMANGLIPFSHWVKMAMILEVSLPFYSMPLVDDGAVQ